MKLQEKDTPKKCSTGISKNISRGYLKSKTIVTSLKENEKTITKTKTSPSITINQTNSQDMKPETFFLPKQMGSAKDMKTLVIDLDETLVHSSLEPYDNPDVTIPLWFNDEACRIYVSVRPGAREFIEELSKFYELVIFTASLEKYASPVIDIVDTKCLSKFRLYREHCTLIDGAYVKDLSKMGRNLWNIILLDNSPIAYSLQNENGIPITTWINDYSDVELYKLLPILKNLSQCPDVRPEIAKFVHQNSFIWRDAMKWMRFNILVPSALRDVEKANSIIPVKQASKAKLKIKNSKTMGNPLCVSGGDAISNYFNTKTKKKSRENVTKIESTLQNSIDSLKKDSALKDKLTQPHNKETDTKQPATDVKACMNSKFNQFRNQMKKKIVSNRNNTEISIDLSTILATTAKNSTHTRTKSTSNSQSHGTGAKSSGKKIEHSSGSKIIKSHFYTLNFQNSSCNGKSESASDFFQNLKIIFNNNKHPKIQNASSPQNEVKERAKSNNKGNRVFFQHAEHGFNSECNSRLPTRTGSNEKKGMGPGKSNSLVRFHQLNFSPQNKTTTSDIDEDIYKKKIITNK